MDEPLCFVHFINALTCSHEESGGLCAGEGGNSYASRLLRLSQTFFPGKGTGEVNGIKTSGSQGSGSLRCWGRSNFPGLSQPEALGT